jgi:hypothetical protein
LKQKNHESEVQNIERETELVEWRNRGEGLIHLFNNLVGLVVVVVVGRRHDWVERERERERKLIKMKKEEEERIEVFEWVSEWKCGEECVFI